MAQPDQAPLKAVLHCNHAAAMHALGQLTEAIADCCAAIALDASYLKAYQRRAEAAMALGDTSSAIQVTQLSGPMLRGIDTWSGCAMIVACATVTHTHVTP